MLPIPPNLIARATPAILPTPILEPRVNNTPLKGFFPFSFKNVDFNIKLILNCGKLNLNDKYIDTVIIKDIAIIHIISDINFNHYHHLII